MKRLASLAVPLLAVTAVLGTAIAVSTPLAGQTTVAGGAVTAVKLVRSSLGIATEGGFDWQDVPGATLTVRVPPRTRALIVARFFAESTCIEADTSETFCALRIKIGGREAAPGNGFNFAFDSANQGGETTTSSEAHAMERSRGPLGAGTYTVKLQWGVHAPGSVFVDCHPDFCFFLDGWSFSAERVFVRT